MDLYINLKKKLKACSKCEKIKAFNQFVKDSGNTYGMFKWCKACQKEHRTKWQKENIIKKPWYNSYNNAKQRCTNSKNPNYPWWGAKGVKFLLSQANIKELWFRDKAYNMKFPTIDRIKNNGHYTFNNCQFLENKENSLKDNVGHSTKRGYIKNYKIGQYNLKGNLIKIWHSQGQISRELRINQGDISHCVNGHRKTLKGYIWKNMTRL